MPAKKNPRKKRSGAKTSSSPARKRAPLFIHSSSIGRFSYLASRWGFWVLNPKVLNLPAAGQGNPNDGQGISKQQLRRVGLRLIKFGNSILKRSSVAGGRPPKYNVEFRIFRDALKTGLTARDAWRKVYDHKKVKARLDQFPSEERAAEKIRLRDAVRKRLKRLS